MSTPKKDLITLYHAAKQFSEIPTEENKAAYEAAFAIVERTQDEALATTFRRRRFSPTFLFAAASTAVAIISLAALVFVSQDADRLVALGLITVPTPAIAASPTIPMVEIAVPVFRLRDRPSFDTYQDVITLFSGQQLTVKARTRDSAWYQVETTSGLAWVAAPAVRTLGNFSGVPLVDDVVDAIPTLPPSDTIQASLLDRVLQLNQEQQELTYFNIALSVARPELRERLLSGTEPLTIFAPSDQAFESLVGVMGVQTFSEVGATVPLLTAILESHMIEGLYTQEVLVAQGDRQLNTLSPGGQLAIRVDPSGAIRVSGASIVMPDQRANNGVIHVIDRIIIRPEVLLSLLRPSEGQ